MSWDVFDLVMAIKRALGLLRGYELSPSVLAQYKCSVCGVSGVKLWRAIHSADHAWCSKCGMAQAGLPDIDIDDEGMHIANGWRTEQILPNSEEGQTLIPWVPDPDGKTWDTEVPPEACMWWRVLPTRGQK